MNGRATLLAIAAVLALGATGSATAQQPAASAVSANAPGEAPIPYTMTMGDMMDTLVQPRHAKLGLAGQAANWPLAAYALAEIREAFAGITKAKPRFRGLPVAELAEAALSQPLAAVDAAIKQHDPQKFAAAYVQLSQGCNACHAALDHAFVVIKPADTSAFANQDFSPRR
jgi:hypothetical protein